MSEYNVELTRRLAAAYNAHEIETVIAACDPSVEFHAAIAAVGGGTATCRTHGQVRSKSSLRLISISASTRS